MLEGKKGKRVGCCQPVAHPCYKQSMPGTPITSSPIIGKTA